MEELKYHYKYPHPAVTTDCVIFGYENGRLKVLLIERGREPYKGQWAFPGGFLNIDESADDGAMRELQEETGLTNAKIHQFHTFTAPNRDPRERVISIAYYALVRLQDVKGGDDAAKAEWFDINDTPLLAFDHDNMLNLAINALRRQACAEFVGRDIFKDKFTLEDFTSLYTAIFGFNPTEEFISSGLIKPIKEKGEILYEFDKNKIRF